MFSYQIFTFDSNVFQLILGPISVLPYLVDIIIPVNEMQLYSFCCLLNNVSELLLTIGIVRPRK